MLFGSWQLKTTVYVLLLTSCLGQELFRVCERDNCFERFDRSRRLNDLSEWQRSNGERHERDKSVLTRERYQLSDENNRIYKVDDLHTEGVTLQNREYTGIDESQSKSDVTRRLDKRSDERHEALKQFHEKDITRRLDNHREHRQTLRQLNDRFNSNLERLEFREILKRSENRGVESRSEDKSEDRLNAHNAEHDLRMRLNENQKERHITQMQSDVRDERFNNLETHRDTNKRLDVPRESQQPEQRLSQSQRDTRRERETKRRDENKSERDLSRRLEIIHEERNEDQRRLEDRRAQREVSKRQIVQNSLKERQTNQIRRGNQQERLERPDATKRINNIMVRRSDDNTEGRRDNLRLFDALDTQRNLETYEERHETLKRSPERRETLMDLHESRNRNTHERVERLETSKLRNNREAHRNSNMHLEDSRGSIRYDERSQNEGETIDRHFENNRERQQCDDNLKFLKERRDVNVAEWRDTLRRNFITNKRLDNSRELVRNDEQLSQKEESIDRRRREINRTRESRKDTSRLLEDREKNTQDRAERQEIAEQLDDRQTQSITSRGTQETRKSIRTDNKLSQRQRESQNRRNENNREVRKDNLCYLEERRNENTPERAERHENSRQINHPKVQLDSNRRLEDSREYIEMLPEREQESTDRRNEKNIKYQERKESSRRVGNTLERVERHKILRRLDERQTCSEDTRELIRKDGRLSESQQESGNRRDENNRERQDENKRERIQCHETLQRINAYEVQRNFNRRLEDTLRFVRNDELLSQRQKESEDRRNDNNKEGKDANNQERIDRRKAFRRIDVPVNRLHSNRRLEDIREFERSDEQFSQKEQETVDNHNKNNEQRYDENKRERTERYVTIRRIEDPKNRLDFNIRSEDTRESVRNIGRHSQREQISINRRNEKNRNGEDENNREQKELRVTFKRIDDREVNHNFNRRLDTPNFLRKDERHSQSERQSIELRDENYRAREERGTLRHLVERKFIMHTEQKFILKQNNNNDNLQNQRFIENVHTEKPTIFLRNGYIVFGQGAILAYVIMKTLNGKNELKFQLPLKLRDAIEMMSF